MSIDGTITWNPSLETFFVQTAERSHCLSWIHKKSEEKYSRYRTFIDLPVIIVSGLTGFLSVGSDSIFGETTHTPNVVLGIASLCVSILNTIGSYFAWSKRAEGHRITSIQYSKLYRLLKIEMSLVREERMPPTELLKYTKEQYDRLQEIAPLVPPSVIADFKAKFNNEKYKDVAFPEETNGLERVKVNTGVIEVSCTPIHSTENRNSSEKSDAIRNPALQIRVPSSE